MRKNKLYFSLIVIILTVLMAVLVDAKTVKIAVLDSGYTKGTLAFEPPICRTYNATDDKTINDMNESKHGTNVLGLIDSTIRKNSKITDYCFYIIKVFGTTYATSVNFTNGLKELIRLGGVDIINISGGGIDGSETEQALINELIAGGAVIIAAAGNDNIDLDKSCQFFPACYKNNEGFIVSVGNGKSYKERYNSSNYGKINVHQWIDGSNKCVIMKKDKSICLSGTSQSTAIYTGIVASGFLMFRNPGCSLKGKCK